MMTRMGKLRWLRFLTNLRHLFPSFSFYPSYSNIFISYLPLVPVCRHLRLNDYKNGTKSCSLIFSANNIFHFLNRLCPYLNKTSAPNTNLDLYALLLYTSEMQVHGLSVFHSMPNKNRILV
jgi:hypothetical protein